nr:Clp protease ATP binding subunit [Conticribra weissflogii]
MFEKFTEGSIKVIMLAQEEARRMGHNFVGTEQLLMGIIGQRHGIGGRALSQLNLTLKKTRKEIEKYIGRGTGFVASEIPFTPRAKRVLEMSIHEAQDLGVNYVGTEHVLLSLLNEPDGIAMRILDKMGVNIPKLRQLVLTYIQEQQEDILSPPGAEFDKWGTQGRVSETPHLDMYCENVTKLAQENKLDPVIGRDSEIQQLVKTLGRRRKNNPVILGEAGVGKTACVEGLALLMEDRYDCPEFLKNNIVLALDLGSVLAGTKYRGEFEDRMKSIIQEVVAQGKIILAIDEIHTLVGAGAAEGAVDAANLLKPALARGTLRVLGATTADEYMQHIEKDPALERRFHPVRVDEPSVKTTYTILQGLKPVMEAHHMVTFSEQSLKAAVELSDRYVMDRNLPDKAIDVIDEAGSRARLSGKMMPAALKKLQEEVQNTINDKLAAVENGDFDLAKELMDHELEVSAHLKIVKYMLGGELMPGLSVGESDIQGVISEWTKIPLNKIGLSEQEKLQNMEKILHSKLIGQDQAVVAASKAIRRGRVGVADPKRPIASFIFAGPTGVGKTELTKALAEFVFNSETNMIRFDMSEFMEKHTVSKLIGSPPGYVGYKEGGQLTEAVRRKPYSIVLFDEVEKAHPDVFNLFLQILDDGQLTDSSHRLVSFKNTIIAMTTNIGAQALERESSWIKDFYNNKEAKKNTQKVDIDMKSDGTISIRAPKKPEIKEEDMKNYENTVSLVHGELKKFFRPELLNRVDEIIVFSHLSKYEIWQIADLMLKSVAKRLATQSIELVVDTNIRYLLTEKGYDPYYGARPLRRVVTKLIEDTLAEYCVRNPFKAGDRITMKLKEKPILSGVGVSSSVFFSDVFTEEIVIEVEPDVAIIDGTHATSGEKVDPDRLNHDPRYMQQLIDQGKELQKKR